MNEPVVRHLPPRERPSWLPAKATGYRLYTGRVLRDVVRYDAPDGPICGWCDSAIAEGDPFALVACADGLDRYFHQACARTLRKEAA